MAEAAAAVPAVAAAPVAGRGRGRGKAKGKGKFKGKFKKVMKVAADGEEAAPKPKKEKAPNLRAQVEAEIGERNIEDVIKEAREQVLKLQAAVSKAQEGEMSYETAIIEGKTRWNKHQQVSTSASTRRRLPSKNSKLPSRH